MTKLLPIGVVMLCGEVALGIPVVAAAQNPPGPGVTGTIATEGTVEKEYKAANIIVVNTVDGVKHAFNFTKDLLVHGGKSPVNAFPGLLEGTTVVVHYTVVGGVESAQEIDRIGDQGVQRTEGVVTRIDRGKKQITIRFDNGKTETLSLTARAAVDVGTDIDQSGAELTKIVVYYTDESGQKVAHYFRRVS